MANPIDQISDILSEIELADDTAAKLIALMDEQRANRNHAMLMGLPAFAKLWNAIDEAARYATRGQ